MSKSIDSEDLEGHGREINSGLWLVADAIRDAGILSGGPPTNIPNALLEVAHAIRDLANAIDKLSDRQWSQHAE